MIQYQVTYAERGRAWLATMDGKIAGGLISLPVDLKADQVVSIDKLGEMGCRVQVDDQCFEWTPRGWEPCSAPS